jgi:hypothetical protein
VAQKVAPVFGAQVSTRTCRRSKSARPWFHAEPCLSWARTFACREGRLRALMKFLPGLIAAALAFFLVNLLDWTTLIENFGWQVVSFFAAYLGAAYITERAMCNYRGRLD